MRIISILILTLVLFLLIPDFAFSQASGSIIGEVYVKEEKDGSGSIYYAVKNECGLGEKNRTGVKRDLSCDRQQITDTRIEFPEILKLSENENIIIQGAPSGYAKLKLRFDPYKAFWMEKFPDGLSPEKTEFGFSWGDGWSCYTSPVDKKAVINCKDNDPASKEYEFFGRFDGDKLRFGDALKLTARIKVESNGTTVFDGEVRPKTLTDEAVLDGDGNVMSLDEPPDPLDFSIFSERPVYLSVPKSSYSTEITMWNRYIGFWVVELETEKDVKSSTLPLAVETDADGNPLLRADLPPETKPGAKVAVVGANPFGEVIYYSGTVNVILRPPEYECRFGISRATKHVFEGRRFCVCGCYDPNDKVAYKEAFNRFTLDGKKIRPTRMSSVAASFLVPEGTSPGLHRISFQSPSDGNIETVSFRVLKLIGNIDQSKLLRGESTLMRLRIAGTEEKLPLVITNKTPGIISIDGGVKQTRRTKGGNLNTLNRRVKGITPGKFDIEYSLNEDRCPCYSDF